MIKVDDLKQWADQHAIGKSATCPHGYIEATDLMFLANEIVEAYPHHWEPVTNTATSNKYTLPSSMVVDFNNPDWDRHRRYKEKEDQL